MAFGSLKAHKLRAGLTTLGIMIGVATIISIQALIAGLDQAFENQISSLGSDNLFVSKIPWSSGADYANFRNRKNIAVPEVDAILKQATLVQAVAPVVATRRIIRYKNQKAEEVLIHGTNDQYKDVASAYPEFGRFILPLEVAHKRNVAVLGWEVADKIFGGIEPIGKKVFVGRHPFHVIGVLEKRGTSLGDNLDSHVYIPLGTFQKLYGSRRTLVIGVKVIDFDLRDEAVDELRGILRRVRKVPADEEDDFAINQQDIITDLYNGLTTGVYVTALGIGSIGLLVAGIGIMNIMLVSVTERTREIGIRRAIGAKRRDILWQFLVESFLISMLGGIMGIGIGFTIAAMISNVSPLPATVSASGIVIGFAFSAAVGIFFGFYPANKAARLDPVEALRYE